MALVRLVHHLGKAPLLAQDEALVPRELEVGAALGIGLQASAVGLVVGQAREADQAPGFVAGAFVWQEIADQLTTAARDDAAPGDRIVAEGIALERVDLVADKADDAHGDLGLNAKPTR